MESTFNSNLGDSSISSVRTVMRIQAVERDGATFFLSFCCYTMVRKASTMSDSVN